MMNNLISKAQFERAQQVMPGGVNSPVRSFRALNAQPIFAQYARGVILTDVDENEYIDFCLSWGVHLLGHGHPQVLQHVRDALELGTSFGMPTVLETQLAEKLVQAVPSFEMVRLVSSGTEAVMSAIRLARGATGRNKIIKFDGCYHGHADHLLVAAGSGVAQLANSASLGVPESFAKHTVSIPFNDEALVRQVFEEQGHDVAAVIVEPVPANMGVVPPREGFLAFLRQITREFGALLIFDEVITGFRPALGGAQQFLDVQPDLTTLGKIIGGGFPVGAYGGRKDLMELVAPLGGVYQAGTLSGNPIAVTAGIQTLELLSVPGFYENLNQKAANFAKELECIVSDYPLTINAFGPMFTLFFKNEKPENYAQVQACKLELFQEFYMKMLARGVYFSPSQFEANFISAAHTDSHLQQTLEAVEDTLKTLSY
jgi:glutamate-1-semialdehyde 2,1-aminomutase